MGAVIVGILSKCHPDGVEYKAGSIVAFEKGEEKPLVKMKRATVSKDQIMVFKKAGATPVSHRKMLAYLAEQSQQKKETKKQNSGPDFSYSEEDEPASPAVPQS